MKRRAEYLVRKRDGRKEWLRASKLARSIRLAARAATASDADGHAGIDDWWALECTTRVLHGLHEDLGKGKVLTTAALARAVQRVFQAADFPQAAVAYRTAGAEQRRRRAVLRARKLLDSAVVAPGEGLLTGADRGLTHHDVIRRV